MASAALVATMLEKARPKEIKYAARGQRAPTRKNQTRPLPNAGVSVKTSDAARWSDVLVYLSLGELARRSDDAPDD